jgi:tetratricopeptide (TPR) repeat protein
MNEPENSIIQENFMAKEIYLHDLKLIDYREYRSHPKISTEQLLLTGTPANIDNVVNKNEDSEWKTVEIPYIDFLERTIALFSKGQNKKALARLQTILATYPDDVNANFYAGLCYFNLKEFSSAQRSFKNCILSKYINFQEEAEWYLALSASANGHIKEAIELFDLIVKRGGYYSKEAKKFLTN